MNIIKVHQLVYGLKVTRILIRFNAFEKVIQKVLSCKLLMKLLKAFDLLDVGEQHPVSIQNVFLMVMIVTH